MVIVIGNTPQKIEIRDLNDCVYYKQQKSFTDSQYDKSEDLKREIKKGTLSVIKRTEEKTGSYDINSSAIAVPTQANTNVMDSSKLDALIERIKSLEESLNQRNASSEGISSEALQDLTGRVERVEKVAPVIANEHTLSELYNSIKKLEERINKSSDNALVLQKLEEIINKTPVIISQAQQAQKEEIRPEDVYVPNVSVEDGNTHIKLNVRTIESGDNVSDSLKKLKELKSKSI